MKNYIKAHRINMGLSQKELGYLLGCEGNGRVSKIEHDECRPKLAQLVLLELLFNKSASRLFPELYREITNELMERLKTLRDHYREAKHNQANYETLEKIEHAIGLLSEDNDTRI